MVRARWLAAAVLLAAACSDDADDRPARWSYIFDAIILPNCATASCHSNFTRTAGLVLETPHGAYVTLVGYQEEGSYVAPFQPHRSQLMSLLRGEEVWRMPPDQPLPHADIALIERWISLGAMED